MNGTRLTSILSLAGLIVGLAALLVLAAAGPGYRLDWWGLGTAFDMFRWAAWSGIFAAAAGFAALLARLKWPVRGAMARAVVAILAAAVAVGLPWSWRAEARSVPPIHDITTDTQDPPAFQAILPLREDAPNPAGYGGEEIAAQQREAYPDLQAQTFSERPDAVFDAALDAAEGMDWKIVAADPQTGRIEAVATTTWFGFKDDVVVRVRERDGRTEVDVRSVSRVGRSDVGKNAERIRAYQALLAERLGGS